MGAKRTTISIPITQSAADQTLVRRLDRLKVDRGLRNRTDMLRVLIQEEWRRIHKKGAPES